MVKRAARIAGQRLASKAIATPRKAMRIARGVISTGKGCLWPKVRKDTVLPMVMANCLASAIPPKKPMTPIINPSSP